MASKRSSIKLLSLTFVSKSILLLKKLKITKGFGMYQESSFQNCIEI